MQEKLMNSSRQNIISYGRQSQDRGRSSKLPHPSLEDQIMKCPRCHSSNTKFCYYNNYSLTQPRHFCKSCKRYWTKGGAIRNIPMGGGCRKQKRSKQHEPLDLDQRPSRASSQLVPMEDQTLMLQKDQHSVASSSHDFFLPSDCPAIACSGLTFERLNHAGSQSISQNSIPLSINWAAEASSDTALNLQLFDQSTILGLNLKEHHVNQELLERLHENDHAPEFSSVYNKQLNPIPRTQPDLADTLGSYGLYMDHYPSHGMVSSNGDLQWTLPQPKMVTMKNGEQLTGYPNPTSSNKGGSRSDQSISFMSSKSLFEDLPLSNLCTATNLEAQRLPSNCTFGDTSAYWGNGSWPSIDL